MEYFFKRNLSFCQRKISKDDGRYSKFVEYSSATLGSGDVKAAVVVPKGEDLDEWLAFNVVDFFNQITILYATLEGKCTYASCPIMCAGQTFQYKWSDATLRKPVYVSGPGYVNLLFNWIQEQLDDETLFPKNVNVPFPKRFMGTIKNIFKRLFRVYAHIYYEHFAEIKELDEEPHLNTSFKHFYYFIKEHNLVEKSELKPLQDLINKYEAKYK